MAKVRMKFRRAKVKTKARMTRRSRNIYLSIGLMFGLVGANFAWDGYKRQDELIKVYEQGKQYYGIIVEETKNTIDRIDKRINTKEKRK